jgi:hypothetical protein
MDNSFFSYLEELELIAFFSGYPLIYSVTIFLSENQHSNNNWQRKTVALLPFSYALVGTLYLGMKLKNLYPDYSFDKIKLMTEHPFLVIWGLLSIIFWIPALAKKTALSLIHSLVFFFILVKDLLLQLSATAANNTVMRNDIKIYMVSLLLNLGAFGLVALISFLVTCYLKRGNIPGR